MGEPQSESAPPVEQTEERRTRRLRVAGLVPALEPNEPLEVARDLRRPTLAFYGDREGFVPVSEIELLKDRFEQSPQSAEVVVYPGAGHAFVNDTRPDADRPEGAANAWRQMVAFLTEQLNR